MVGTNRDAIQTAATCPQTVLPLDLPCPRTVRLPLRSLQECAEDGMGGPASWKDRIIIALDLDAFYVAASRKRDPSLIGLPVGIKQKGILATVSYEARRQGVKKLATIRDGMSQCPEMVLVNGEDLSYFRKLSGQVFHLVSSMIWQGRVEKLGMDELFCDCTEMIEAEMAKETEKVGSEEALSFSPVGHVLPVETEREVQARIGSSFAHLPRQTRMLFLATHLAQRIRARVAEEIGLTSSAGIATSKLVAKLVGNVYKPSQQTVFASLSEHQAQPDIRRFLDPFPLRTLNGFGSAIVEKLCEAACKSLSAQEPGKVSDLQLTVSLARQIFDGQSLKELFGQRLGSRLADLLQGQDDEPVVKAPEFPAQISIEDSYRGLQGPALREQIYILGLSLLRRLETELIEADGQSNQALTPAFEVRERAVAVEQGKGLDYKVREYQEREEPGREERRLGWKRYPLSVRLSIRQGWDNRVSRQGRMPVEVFDLRLAREERAKVLAHNLESTLKAIFASDGDRGQGVNLVNIAALDLSPHRPASAIGGFLKAKVRADDEGQATALSYGAAGHGIDLSFLKGLPPDLRAEIAKEYKLKLDDDDGGQEGLRCQRCGQVQEGWLQHDHVRWPNSGLPTRNDDTFDWLLDGVGECDGV